MSSVLERSVYEYLVLMEGVVELKHKLEYFGTPGDKLEQRVAELARENRYVAKYNNEICSWLYDRGVSLFVLYKHAAPRLIE